MRPRAVVCPNPKCNKTIEEPVLLNNLSVTPAEHYYACSHCFMKMHAYPYLHRNLRSILAGLFALFLGSAILAWVGWLIWYDSTIWGKDLYRIFFGSRIDQTMSLGIGMMAIYYFLIGLALSILGLVIFVRRRSMVVELRFGAVPPESQGVHDSK